MTDMETDSAPRRYTDAMQPPDLSTRSTEAGDRASLAAGRRGRATSSPPQFGHMPCSTEVAHASQNVHSNEQIRASIDSGGRSRSQHSQLGRSWSMGDSELVASKVLHERQPTGAVGWKPPAPVRVAVRAATKL